MLLSIDGVSSADEGINRWLARERTPDLVDELVVSGRLRQRKPAEETLRDLRHGLGDSAHVLRAQARHAHAARAHQVHGVLLAQAVDLHRRQAGVAEHAALGEEVVERAARQAFGEGSVQALAHGLDARAHAFQLVLPALAQFRRGQHLGDDARAVHGRARIVLAHGELQLAQHQRGLDRKSVV